MIFKTSDGIKLNYQLRGQGKPVVLINGFGSYQGIWYEQVEYLTKMGYAVLTFDHRNMGASQRTKSGHTLQRLTDDLIELLTYLKISEAAFIGHSMGGSILLDLIKTKPSLVKLAIIVDQSPYMLNTSSWPYGFMNYTPDNYLTETQKIPAVRETLNGLSSAVAGKLAQEKVAHPFDRQDNLDLLQEHSKLDWRNVIKETQVKLVFVAAKSSPYYDYRFTNWIKDNNSQAEIAIVENCGHDIMAEIPQRFNQLLRHFLLKNRYLS